MIAAIREHLAGLQCELKGIDRRLKSAEAGRLPVLPLGKLSVALDSAATKFRKLAGELGKPEADGEDLYYD